MNKNYGFTLTEVLIAAAVLAVALVGLLGAFISNFRLIESARNLTTAINHGRSVMEEIRDFNIPEFVTVQDWTAWAQTEPPGGGGCTTLNNELVTVAYPSGEAAEPLEILVTVNWSEKGRPRSVQLAGLLAER